MSGREQAQLTHWNELEVPCQEWAWRGRVLLQHHSRAQHSRAQHTDMRTHHGGADANPAGTVRARSLGGSM